MSEFGSNPPLRGRARGYRRTRVPLNFDLNAVPLDDMWTPDVIRGSRGGLRGEQVSRRSSGLPYGGGRQLVLPIDVEAIDDSLVISSPRSIREGRNHSRHNHVAMTVLDDDSDVYQSRSGAIIPEEPVTIEDSHIIITEEPVTSRSFPNNYNNYGRNSFNCGLDINLEDRHILIAEEPVTTRFSPNTYKNYGRNSFNCGLDNSLKDSHIAKEPIFSCPVCLGALKEETSTICGHIFCRECISTAIEVQKKCPTCRQKLTINNIHRVFLPSRLN